MFRDGISHLSLSFLKKVVPEKWFSYGSGILYLETKKQSYIRRKKHEKKTESFHCCIHFHHDVLYSDICRDEIEWEFEYQYDLQTL